MTDAAIQEQSATPPRPAPGLFWPCFWLAVALVACKAVLIGHGPDFARSLAIAAHQDLIFAAALWLVGEATLCLFRRRPRARRITWWAFTTLAMLEGVYGVVSIYVFAYAGAPLTVSMIAIAGGPGDIGSSIAFFCTPPRVAALVGVPLGILLLTLFAPRWLGRSTPALRWTGALAVIAYVLLTHRAAAQRDWLNRPDHRASISPQWALVHSFATDLFSDHPPYIGDYRPEPATDFQTVGERGTTQPSSTLPTLIPPNVPRPKNVILFVIESCGAEHLALYGSPYDATPRLNAAAQHALIFDAFYAHQGLTVNALASISLSILPPITGWPVTSREPNLPGTTLQRVLKPLGYRSAFVGSGDNTYLNQSDFLANRGFDDVLDAHSLEATFGCQKLFSWGVEDHYTIDALIQWIDRDPTHARPFYALTWTQQTHHPYELAPGSPQVDYLHGQPHPAARDYNRYLNCLHETDAQIGRLLDALAARHLADDTLLIVTGDHGEAFGLPHGVWGHGSHVYDENLRVPLLVCNPRLFPHTHRMPQVGGQIDLNPTILDLLAVDVKPPDTWQGRSLFDPTRPDRTYGLSVNGDALLSVRQSNWKYIYNASLGRETLFDLSTDPTEQRDAAFEHRALCDDLRQRLAARIATGVRQYADLSK